PAQSPCGSAAAGPEAAKSLVASSVAATHVPTLPLPVRRSGPRAGSPRRSLRLERAMLTIDQATYDGIVAHAKKDHPDEAGGIVAGPEGSARAQLLVAGVHSR